MINVLWIDDQSNDAFIMNAEDEGLNIKVEKNVDDGISTLLNTSTNFDAIILDANCLKHKKDAEGKVDVNALSYALKEITRNKITLPWFVYSSGGFSGEQAIDVIVSSYEREYDDVNWYHKPKDMNSLFDKIKGVVPKADYYRLKRQYAYVVDSYPNQDELINIIGYLDDNKSREPSVFNLIRKELDFIMEECDKCGMLTVERTGANLNECSKALGDRRLEKFIPVYIQRALHSATTICNEGSHRLVIDTDVREGKAPTLVRSTVYEFLNIVYWYNESLPKTDEEIEKYKKDVQEELNKKCTDPNDPAYYEGQTMEYEKDENGDYHCGLCCIKKDYEVINKGTQIVLHGITTNMNARTKERYPLFAKKIENKK